MELLKNISAVIVDIKVDFFHHTLHASSILNHNVTLIYI